MKRFSYIFIFLFVIVILLQLYTIVFCNQTKLVKFDVTLINNTHKIIESEVPIYAKFHIYETKLQYQEKTGYYRTIYYNVIDFKKLK